MSGLITYDDQNRLISVKGYESVEIKSSCTSIFGESATNYAFKDVTGILVSVTFEEDPKLQTISQYSFYKCTQLQEIDLGKCNKLQSIGNYAFSECSGLSKVIFPSSLTSLGQYSFSNLTKLTSVFLPASVQKVQNYCFSGCTSLTNFTLEEGSQLTDFTDHVLVNTKVTSFSFQRISHGFQDIRSKDAQR